MSASTSGWSWLAVLSGAADIATIGALFYAGYQFKLGRRVASATASSLILSNIKNRVVELAAQEDDDALYEATCNLLNEIELSCALYFDGQFVGETGALTVSLLKDILSSLEKNPILLDYTQRAIHNPDTFKCLRKFAKKYKNDWKALKSPGKADSDLVARQK